MHSEGKTMENKLVSIIVPVYNVAFLFIMWKLI